MTDTLNNQNSRNQTKFGKPDPERGVFAKPPICQPETGNEVVMVPALIMANDGFINRVAGLGSASPLAASGTFVPSGLTGDNEKLQYIYSECAVAKRIIDIPSEEMTRAWYTLQANTDEKDLQMLQNLEAKHSIKQELTNAIRWGRLFGGAIAIMVIDGDDDRMEIPLNTNSLLLDSFKGLSVVDPTQGITPSLEVEENLNDTEYGLPKYYEVNISTGNTGETKPVRIHHSRVLRFIGRELPHADMVRNNYWGASELQHPWDEISRYLNTCGNIERLVFMANLITLKMGNFGSDLTFGSDRMKEKVEKAIEEENRYRTSYGTQVMSSEDSLETHDYNFAGLAEIKESFMLDVAGAAEIPVTRLFGRCPQGMNATGESDQRNFCDMIAQQQERVLRPALEKLLPVMAVSCWGFVPKEMRIIFNPLMTMTPAERAELSRIATLEIIEAVKCGLISIEEGRKEMFARGSELGTWGSHT